MRSDEAVGACRGSVGGPAEVKTCPACAEEVRRAAVVCRFCYHRFADPAPALAAAAPAPIPPAPRAAAPQVPFVPLPAIAGAIVAGGALATAVVVLAFGAGRASHPAAPAVGPADRAAMTQGRL